MVPLRWMGVEGEKEGQITVGKIPEIILHCQVTNNKVDTLKEKKCNFDV